MTTIKATCPTCGEVRLTSEDIELRVDHSGATESYYCFECPICESIVRKHADDRVVRLLITGGVPALDRFEPPGAPVHAPRFPGPAIDHDDLLDFHTLLADPHDAWFQQLRAMVGWGSAA